MQVSISDVARLSIFVVRLFVVFLLVCFDYGDHSAQSDPRASALNTNSLGFRV